MQNELEQQRQQTFNFLQFETALVASVSGEKLTETEAYIASYLLEAKREHPRSAKEIIGAVRDVFGKTLSERSVRDAIRTLRKSHALPILASRRPPHGYFWCGSIDEMSDFVKVFRSQALDELHTLARIIKTNYPSLAGQLNFADDTEAEN